MHVSGWIKPNTKGGDFSGQGTWRALLGPWAPGEAVSGEDLCIPHNGSFPGSTLCCFWGHYMSSICGKVLGEQTRCFVVPSCPASCLCASSSVKIMFWTPIIYKVKTRWLSEWWSVYIGAHSGLCPHSSVHSQPGPSAGGAVELALTQVWWQTLPGAGFKKKKERCWKQRSKKGFET